MTRTPKNTNFRKSNHPKILSLNMPSPPLWRERRCSNKKRCAVQGRHRAVAGEPGARGLKKLSVGVRNFWFRKFVSWSTLVVSFSAKMKKMCLLIFLRCVLFRKDKSWYTWWLDLFCIRGTKISVLKLVYFRAWGLGQLSDPRNTSILKSPQAPKGVGRFQSKAVAKLQVKLKKNCYGCR